MLAALLLAADPAVTTPDSPVAEIITVSAAGVAAVITALAGWAGVKRRRAADAELATPDPENSITRLRERLTTLEAWAQDARDLKLGDRTTKTEARLDEQARRIGDLEEQMSLRRAADVVFEAEQAPRRRRRAAE
jgi:hypothetical protein